MTTTPTRPAVVTRPPRTSLAPAHDRTATVLLAGYVALWVVEGAFRKWVPGTSLVFYVARDVYAVAVIVWLASSRRPARRSTPPWLLITAAVLGVWLAVQLLTSGGVWPVVLLFGLRSYLAPALFALLAYRYADERVLRRCADVIAVLVPVELGLTIVQVLSPASAFVNIEVGGTPNIFVNGGEVVRATGSFSAPQGLTTYALIALAVGLWWTLDPSRSKQGWVVLTAVLAIAALSGARGTILNSAVLIVAYIGFALVRPVRGSARRVVPLLVLLAITLIVVQIALPEVLSSFVTRFSDASESENSSDRLFDGFTAYLGQYPDLVGDGMGVRSNAGIALGSTVGWVENDSLRWVAELGVLGWLLALARTVGTLALTWQAVRRIRIDPPAVTMLRVALVLLLALGSVNSTPTAEGATAILLGLLVVATTEEPRPVTAPAHGRRRAAPPRRSPGSIRGATPPR